MSSDDQKALGVSDSLVRISVGIEDWRDLLHDFQQALDSITNYK
jgi:methionine-gamma-lyase